MMSRFTEKNTTILELLTGTLPMACHVRLEKNGESRSSPLRLTA